MEALLLRERCHRPATSSLSCGYGLVATERLPTMESVWLSNLRDRWNPKLELGWILKACSSTCGLTRRNSTAQPAKRTHRVGGLKSTGKRWRCRRGLSIFGFDSLGPTRLGGYVARREQIRSNLLSRRRNAVRIFHAV